MEVEPGESSWGQDSVLTEASEGVRVQFWRVRFFCYKLEAKILLLFVVNLHLQVKPWTSCAPEGVKRL